MFLPAFLLRCLLALALMAGGVPTAAMASDIPVDDQASAMTRCHDLAVPDPAPEKEPAASGAMKNDSCGSADCPCDCLQHMPVAALALPTLATLVFCAQAPGPRSLVRISRSPSATLRPPIC